MFLGRSVPVASGQGKISVVKSGTMSEILKLQILHI